MVRGCPRGSGDVPANRCHRLVLRSWRPTPCPEPRHAVSMPIHQLTTHVPRVGRMVHVASARWHDVCGGLRRQRPARLTGRHTPGPVRRSDRGSDPCGHLPLRGAPASGHPGSPGAWWFTETRTSSRRRAIWILPGVDGNGPVHSTFPRFHRGHHQFHQFLTAGVPSSVGHRFSGSRRATLSSAVRDASEGDRSGYPVTGPHRAWPAGSWEQIGNNRLVVHPTAGNRQALHQQEPMHVTPNHSLVVPGFP